MFSLYKKSMLHGSLQNLMYYKEPMQHIVLEKNVVLKVTSKHDFHTRFKLQTTLLMKKSPRPQVHCFNSRKENPSLSDHVG